MSRNIVVTAIKDDTFYAIIWIQQNGKLISIDSRPSDALALALRIDCPILVRDEVLQNSKGKESGSEQMPNEDLKRWLDMMTRTWEVQDVSEQFFFGPHL